MSLFPALSVGASGMAAQRARAELLVENALRCNVASNLLRVQIQSIRSAIKEGQSS